MPRNTRKEHSIETTCLETETCTSPAPVTHHKPEKWTERGTLTDDINREHIVVFMPAFKAEAGEAAAQTWTEASLRELKESSHMTALQ